MYFLGGYNRNKTRPAPTTTNPTLLKWLKSRVGTIPSEPFFYYCKRNINICFKSFKPLESSLLPPSTSLLPYL